MALTPQFSILVPVGAPQVAASASPGHASHRPSPSKEAAHGQPLPRWLTDGRPRASLPPCARDPGRAGQGMVRVDVAARLALLGLLAAPAASHGGMSAPHHTGNPLGAIAVASQGIYRCEGRAGKVYQQHPCRHLEGAPLALPPAAGPAPEPPAVAKPGDRKGQAERRRSAARQTAKGLKPTPAQVRAADERLRVKQGGEEGAAKSSRRSGGQRP